MNDLDILKEQNYKCLICKKPLEEKNMVRVSFVLVHFNPVCFQKVTERVMIILNHRRDIEMAILSSEIQPDNFFYL